MSDVPADTVGNMTADANRDEARVVLTTDELIKFHAKNFGVLESSLRATLRCESELKHDAHGDGGLAYGIAQFHEETFNEFKELAGMPELGYHSKEDQIKLMAWAFANDRASHWSCWRKYKAKKLALK